MFICTAKLHLPLQEITQGGKKKDYKTKARLVSLSEVQCEMPDVKYASFSLELSVSNDDKKYSDEVSVFVFDSKCLDCTTATSPCPQKVRCIF